MCVDQTYTRSPFARQSEEPFFPEAREKGALFIDANSALRNGASAASAITTLPAAVGLFVAGSAAAGGILGVPIGFAVACDGIRKARRAAAESDWEGVAHNAVWTGVGAGYAGLSSILGTAGIMTLAHKAVPQAINTAFGGLGVGFYGLLLGYGAYGLWKSRQFNGELNQAKEGGRAAEWIVEQAVKPGFDLRVGAAAGKLVRERLIAGGPIDDALVLEVEKGCFKESVKHILLVVLALLGIAASLCVLFLAGPASPLLFAISAIIWVGVDSSSVHEYLGEKFWSWSNGGTLPSPANDPSEKEEQHPAA